MSKVEVITVQSCPTVSDNFNNAEEPITIPTKEKVYTPIKETENYEEAKGAKKGTKGQDEDFLAETQEKKQESLNCFSKFQKVIGMGPGSFNSCIFNLCILLIGTGCLALPQKAASLSLVFLPIGIIIAGMANILSFFVLAEMSDRYQIRTYSGIVKYLYGKGLSIFLDIILIFNTAGTILIYQVVVYKLVGGVINDLGGLGYKSVDDFLENSFWSKTWCKFSINYGLTIIILIPGCLLKNISGMRFISVFGIISFSILILIIIIQSPWFAKHYFQEVYQKNDPDTHLNIFDIGKGFTKDMDFFKSIATIFFAYSCQIGVFPIIDSLENNTLKRTKSVFKVGTIISMVCYIVVGILGYLTQPINTPDMIFERETIFKNDIIMTIGRIFIILALITKIPVNYNGIRIIFLEHCGFSLSDFPNWINFVITIVTLFIISLICSLYQSITDYISLVGSFCTSVIAFLIPGLIYIKGSGLGYSFKNVGIMILSGILTLLGFISGILTIISMINGD